ncbi:ALF repeat-containing protein [Streptomyces goshikiensis]|uniref:ALF repeat-containing protein n=1 Tax=Streptomyces goshikiensis TaxID=1942 RepID=UPI00332A4E01
MKLIRAALVLTAGALAPALLLATPSLAAAAPVTVAASASTVVGSDTENAVAIAKILADPASGRAVKREANKALDGTPADRVAFLTTGLAKAQDEDNLVTIVKLLPTGGRAVVREANKALDGTALDRTAFLKTGLRLARAEDDRVEVVRILARPGISDGLRAAAEKALNGTPEELRSFITVGQYQV